jgi:hypothetical protein
LCQHFERAGEPENHILNNEAFTVHTFTAYLCPGWESLPTPKLELLSLRITVYKEVMEKQIANEREISKEFRPMTAILNREWIGPTARWNYKIGSKSHSLKNL